MEIALIGAIAAMLWLALGEKPDTDRGDRGLLVGSVKAVAGTRNIRSLRNGGAGPESPASVVAGGRNTRFLRLVEQTIPNLAA